MIDNFLLFFAIIPNSKSISISSNLEEKIFKGILSFLVNIIQNSSYTSSALGHGSHSKYKKTAIVMFFILFPHIIPNLFPN
jgi:hypothetical protein